MKVITELFEPKSILRAHVPDPGAGLLPTVCQPWDLMTVQYTGIDHNFSNDRVGTMPRCFFL